VCRWFWFAGLVTRVVCYWVLGTQHPWVPSASLGWSPPASSFGCWAAPSQGMQRLPLWRAISRRLAEAQQLTVLRAVCHDYGARDVLASTDEGIGVCDDWLHGWSFSEMWCGKAWWVGGAVWGAGVGVGWWESGLGIRFGCTGWFFVRLGEPGRVRVVSVSSVLLLILICVFVIFVAVKDSNG